MNLRIVDNVVTGLPKDYIILLLVRMTLRNTPCFGAVICPVHGYPPLGARSTEIFEAKIAVFSEKGVPVSINNIFLFGQKFSAGGGRVEAMIERTKDVVEWTTRGTAKFFGVEIRTEDILVAH